MTTTNSTDEYKNRIFEYLTRLLARNTSRPATIIRSMPVWPGFCASATIHAVHCVLGCVSHFWHNACRFAGAPVTERTGKKKRIGNTRRHRAYYMYSMYVHWLRRSLPHQPTSKRGLATWYHRFTEKRRCNPQSQSFFSHPASFYQAYKHCENWVQTK